MAADAVAALQQDMLTLDFAEDTFPATCNPAEMAPAWPHAGMPATPAGVYSIKGNKDGYTRLTQRVSN